jgi:hypothetical protein
MSDEILSGLRTAAATYERVFIVVDALDECQPSDGSQTAFLTEVFNLRSAAGASLNVFVTSRPGPDIVRMFDKFPSLAIRAKEEDIQQYLRGHMGELLSFVARNKGLQEDIIWRISTAADGV